MQRARRAAALYTPAALMAGLALGTWWLVQSNPPLQHQAPPETQARRMDYEMQNFATSSYDAAGKATSEIQGSHLFHYSTNDLLIQNPRMQGQNRKGQTVRARAAQAVGNDSATDVTLIGGVDIQQEGEKGPLQLQGSRIRITDRGARAQSNEPVRIQNGKLDFSAGSMDYDAHANTLQLGGRVHGTIAP